MATRDFTHVVFKSKKRCFHGGGVIMMIVNYITFKTI
jgi:hypothetical protein